MFSLGAESLYESDGSCDGSFRAWRRVKRRLGFDVLIGYPFQGSVFIGIWRNLTGLSCLRSSITMPSKIDAVLKAGSKMGVVILFIGVVIEDTMRERNLRLPAVLVVFATLMLSGGQATVPSTNPHDSFFVVNHFFSDDLPSGFDEILSVAPQGVDVCVRVIHISLVNRFCGAQLVRAAERTLPNTTVRKVTGGADPCSYTEQQVEASLKAAAANGAHDPSDSSTFDVVANCGGQERVFEFPYPAEVDEKLLRRDNPRIDALWNLNYKVRSLAFGKHFSFYDLPPDKEKESEELGTGLLPELVSGTFEAGFDGYTCAGHKCDTNYLAWRLRGYAGAPANRSPSVEIIDADALHAAHYDLPQYPLLAAMTRISGEVRLQIFIDKQTGLVKDVRQISGHPLLGKAAIDAVKKWQFFPEAQPDQSVEAVLKFSLCHGER